ncbi:TlpA family protein disulfide reductase [Psychroserpens damuponensis]|uniref:TlpA family protein disulfide reductase n=1 Tax=Psychroserpens damuponensis TaxID=943936 RepID=UPI0005901405|nr:TlpA disulfide reductase family protein [Psychroserpens damuponensis]
MAKQPKRFKISNIIFIVIIALLIIPQTRQPIQVFLQKGIAMFVKPSVIDTSERLKLTSYNWSLKDLEGETFDFSSAEGKVIVINFWATWCPPCIAEMPSLDQLYQHYKSNDDVVFLFVSNEDTELINNFITNKSYSFNAYQSLTNYPQEFDVTSIPRTYVISKKGEIVIDKSGAADWNSDTVISTIDELLQ